MKSLGKILLFIGSLIFFVVSILDIIDLVTTCIKSPDTFWNYDPKYAGFVAFALLVISIIIVLFAGLNGLRYSLKGTHGEYVKIISIIIMIFFVISIVNFAVNCIKTSSFSWNNFYGVFAGSVASILYMVGYFMDMKRV
jgi:hypothetical protein